MAIFGIIFCILSFFLIYKRLSFMLFGKSAIGVIVGYSDPFRGTRGAKTYQYKVKYQYDNMEYVAYSLESVATFGNNPKKNFRRTVTVYFKENRPEVVTIKEFNATLIYGLILLILGVVAMFVPYGI